MKFYYKDKLIRTSKSHIYTHAVIDMTTGGLIGCRSSETTARQVISTEISQWQRGIKNYQSLLKAIEQGKQMFRLTEGRRSWYEPVGNRTVEHCNKCIKHSEEQIQYIIDNWQVVELEARDK